MERRRSPPQGLPRGACDIQIHRCVFFQRLPCLHRKGSWGGDGWKGGVGVGVAETVECYSKDSTRSTFLKGTSQHVSCHLSSSKMLPFRRLIRVLHRRYAGVAALAGAALLCCAVALALSSSSATPTALGADELPFAAAAKSIGLKSRPRTDLDPGSLAALMQAYSPPFQKPSRKSPGRCPSRPEAAFRHPAFASRIP